MLPRFLVPFVPYLGPKTFPLSVLSEQEFCTAVFNVCRACPWGSCRDLSLLGFLPQTTVGAALWKWQLAVARTHSLSFSPDCCVMLVVVLRGCFSLIASSSPLHHKKIFLCLVDPLDRADIVPLAFVPYFLCLRAILVFFLLAFSISPLLPSASKFCCYALLDKSHSRKSSSKKSVAGKDAFFYIKISIARQHVALAFKCTFTPSSS